MAEESNNIEEGLPQESMWGGVKDIARNVGIAVGIGVAAISGILLTAVLAIKTGLTGPEKPAVPVPVKEKNGKDAPPKGKQVGNGQNFAPAAAGEIAAATGEAREAQVEKLREKGILPKGEADLKGMGR